MADLTIHELQNETSTPADNDYMALDGATAGTRKITLANLATWIHNKWAAFVNALTAKTSFANGDKIPVVNGSAVTAMGKDDLLRLTEDYASSMLCTEKQLDFTGDGNAVLLYDFRKSKKSIVHIHINSTWTVSSVNPTYNKLYVDAMTTDGLKIRTLINFLQNDAMPSDIYFVSPNDNEISFLRLGLRGDQGQTISVTISEHTVTDKNKISPFFVQNGNVYFGTDSFNFHHENNFRTRLIISSARGFRLKAGDMIVADLSEFRYYVGWITDDPRTYNNNGNWIQGSFVAPADGEYYLLFGSVGDSFDVEPKMLADNILIFSSEENTVNNYSWERFKSYVNACKSYEGIAHRGYSYIYPENTMLSFVGAAELGFKIVETDIRFTSDGIPVCIHDSTIDRTSDGSGAVSSFSYEQLLEFDFGSWKSAEFAGTKILSLAHFLDIVKCYGLTAWLELKELTQSEILAVVKLVEHKNCGRNVVYITGTSADIELLNNNIKGGTFGYICSTVSAGIGFFNALPNNGNRFFLDSNLLTEYSNAATSSYPFFVWLSDNLNQLIRIPDDVAGYASNIYDYGRIKCERNFFNSVN